MCQIAANRRKIKQLGMITKQRVYVKVWERGWGKVVSNLGIHYESRSGALLRTWSLVTMREQRSRLLVEAPLFSFLEGPTSRATRLIRGPEAAGSSRLFGPSATRPKVAASVRPIWGEGGSSDHGWRGGFSPSRPLSFSITLYPLSSWRKSKQCQTQNLLASLLHDR